MEEGGNNGKTSPKAQVTIRVISKECGPVSCARNFGYPNC